MADRHMHTLPCTDTLASYAAAAPVVGRGLRARSPIACERSSGLPSNPFVQIRELAIAKVEAA